ncbi:MAG: alpha/beta fold hydrolase [Actinomycetota bacterium]
MTSASATDDAWSAPDAGGPLDLLLSDAALGPLRRLNPGRSGVRLARALARRPDVVGAQAATLAHELAQVARGHSTLAPAPKDRRFTDPAWSRNPLLRRSLQAYLATSTAATEVVDAADLDWADAEKVRFVVDNLVAALAPSNNPVLNPLAWKALVDTGGANVVNGVAHLVKDLASKPRVPAMVEGDAFDVGRTIAVTPGAVVLRTPAFELIQYRPQTPRVRRIPLLIVPPMINKYYVIDLAPERSLVEHLVRQGQQVFVMSWRNPDERHRDWNLDTYGQAVLDAMDATDSICRVDSTHLLSLCSGGIMASMLAAHLAATGGLHRVASFAAGVTVLDQGRAGLTSAAMDPATAKAAVDASAARGYLDGRALAEVFAWLRPGDLIWNYWVNNYLQGNKPPAFDVLFWNADTTRMPAALHRQFIEMALANSLTVPGSATMLGTPVDLSRVDVDSYVIAGVADHICPWQSCYATTQLLGGSTRFVLSTAGHIASLVNPPTNAKATYRTHPSNPADPERFLREADTVQGTWWVDYAAWLEPRSGGDKARPRALGNARHRVGAAAPGTYVFDR